MKTYSWKVRVGAAASQFVNAAFLGGHMNETISARADRLQHSSKVWAAVRVVADKIFGEGHCASSREEDRQFARDILAEESA